MSRSTAISIKWHVRPADVQISPRICISDECLLCPHEEALGLFVVQKAYNECSDQTNLSLLGAHAIFQE